MIKMFCKDLPFNLSQALYNEYNSRKYELNYIYNKSKTHYDKTIDNIDSIYLLLAVSIYYKRVIANLYSANAFYQNVKEISDVERIKIGSFIIDSEEASSLKKTVKSFQSLLLKFNIPLWVLEFSDINHFLRNVIHHSNNIKKIESFEELDEDK